MLENEPGTQRAKLTSNSIGLWYHSFPHLEIGTVELELEAVCRFVFRQLLLKAIKLAIFVKTFRVRLPACSYFSIGTKILVHSGYFVVRLIAVRQHLTSGAKRLVGFGEGRVAILHSYDRKFSALGAFPVFAFIEHLLHFGW